MLISILNCLYFTNVYNSLNLLLISLNKINYLINKMNIHLIDKLLTRI